MTVDPALLAMADQMSAEAGAQEEPQFCVEGEPVFFLEAPGAVRPGHIYSADGRREFAISKSCEFHFDLWFSVTDDEEDLAEEG